MALPASAIDQLSRNPVGTPGWSGRLLMFSSTLFFLSLSAFFGLNFGYKPYLDRQADRLDNESRIASQEIAAGEQVKVVDFYSQLANLEKILKSHVYASQAFAFFENTTLPRIYFSKLDFNAPTRRANLTGMAESVEDVTKQVQLFQGRPEVESATFSNVTLLAGGKAWQFDVSIIFAPGFLTTKEMTVIGEAFSDPGAFGDPAATTKPIL